MTHVLSVRRLTGEVVAVDVHVRVLTLRVRALRWWPRHMTFDVTREAARALDGLRTGDRVRVLYHLDHDRRTAQAVTMLRAAIPGRASRRGKE